MKKEKGITLIALVVTIIILLILAGVTIRLVMGNQGVFNKAGEAQKQTVIQEEKEQIKLAVLSVKTENIPSDKIDKQVTKEQLEQELKKVKEGIEVIDNEDGTLWICYVDTKRQYLVDEERKITKEEEYAAKKEAQYGTAIQSNYSDLYLAGSKEPIQKLASDAYYNGNYKYANALRAGMLNQGNEAINTSSYSNGRSKIAAGNNTFNFVREADLNRWVVVYITGGSLTANVSIGSFSLKYSDGTSFTLQQSAEKGYIEPLVVSSSSSSSSSYLFKNMYNMVSGGTTGNSSFATATICFKVKDKSKLKGVGLYSSKIFDEGYQDGLGAYELKEGSDLSIESF